MQLTEQPFISLGYLSVPPRRCEKQGGRVGGFSLLNKKWRSFRYSARRLDFKGLGVTPAGETNGIR
jgi:hypothetical protein